MATEEWERAGLTRPEITALELFSRGWSRERISKETGLKVSTIQSRLNVAARKLGEPLETIRLQEAETRDAIKVVKGKANEFGRERYQLRPGINLKDNKPDPALAELRRVMAGGSNEALNSPHGEITSAQVTAPPAPTVGSSSDLEKKIDGQFLWLLSAIGGGFLVLLTLLLTQAGEVRGRVEQRSDQIEAKIDKLGDQIQDQGQRLARMEGANSAADKPSATSAD